MKRITLVVILCLFISISTNYIDAIGVSDCHAQNLNLSQEFDLNIDENDLMTYDEMLNRMIADGYSKEEALNMLNPPSSLKSGVLNDIVPMNLSYTTKSVTLNVTSLYKPTLNFYIEIDGAHGAYYMNRVLNVNMNRNYNNITKQFQGSIFYNLETPTRLYYTIDGDFYNLGNSSISGGGSIGIGQSSTINFSLTYASKYYSNIYISDYLHYGNNY